MRGNLPAISLFLRGLIDMNDRYSHSTWMWAEACSLIDEAERMHRRFFDLLAVPSAAPVWEPPINVVADGRELAVVVAIPGAEPRDVAVQLVGGVLQIEVRVPAPKLAGRANIVRLEIPYGIMRRRIELPSGRYALAEHRLNNGCLYLRLMESSQ